jgi:hypothetical protein
VDTEEDGTERTYIWWAASAVSPYQLYQFNGAGNAWTDLGTSELTALHSVPENKHGGSDVIHTGYEPWAFIRRQSGVKGGVIYEVETYGATQGRPEVTSQIGTGAAAPFDLSTASPSPALKLPIQPGTVSITYPGGGARTITDDGAGGLTGDVTGGATIDYATGAMVGNTSVNVDNLGVINQDYSSAVASPAQQEVIHTGAGATLDLSTVTPVAGSGLPIRPNSVLIEYISGAATQRVRDDGAGVLVGDLSVAGTINYATGAMTGTTNVVDNATSVTYDYAQNKTLRFRHDTGENAAQSPSTLADPGIDGPIGGNATLNVNDLENVDVDNGVTTYKVKHNLTADGINNADRGRVRVEIESP